MLKRISGKILPLKLKEGKLGIELGVKPLKRVGSIKETI